MADSYDLDGTSKNAFIEVLKFILTFVLRIIVLLVIVIVFQNAIARGYDFGFGVFSGKPMSDPPGRDVSFVIEEGESKADIIDALLNEGLIEDKFAFYTQIYFYDDDMLPGEYTLNTSMSAKEILKELSKGPSE